MQLADYFQFFSSNIWLFYLVVFIFSLSIGSFLNVVIYRVPIMLEREWKKDCSEYLELKDYQPNTSKFNLSQPASACPKCKTKIRFWQNIPIISYILLGGKCANCKTRISIQYPMVELITGILAVVVAYHYGVSIQTFFALLLTFALIALSLIDAKHTILPDSIVFPFLWLGLLVNQYSVFTDSKDALFGAVIGYLSLWSVYQVFKILTGKEGMGFGDFKLLACLGAWVGASHLLPIILISSIVGATFGITMILLKKNKVEQAIPFGPYLAVAGWITLLWGDQLVQMYLGASNVPF